MFGKDTFCARFSVATGEAGEGFVPYPEFVSTCSPEEHSAFQGLEHDDVEFADPTLAQHVVVDVVRFDGEHLLKANPV